MITAQSQNQFSWTSFLSLGGLAGFVSLIWQLWKEGSAWRGRPNLRFEAFDPSRDLRVWSITDSTAPGRAGEHRKVFTLEVLNRAKRTAQRSVATITITRWPRDVQLAEKKFSLHWAGVDYGPQTTGAQAVDIGSEGRRLDIAFTVDGQAQPGCWLATPYSLLLPVQNQAYLAPGNYEADVALFCDGGRGETVRVHLYSPNSWRDLDASTMR